MSEVRLILLCCYQLVLLCVIDLYMFRACIWTFYRLERAQTMTCFVQLSLSTNRITRVKNEPHCIEMKVNISL